MNAPASRGPEHFEQLARLLDLERQAERSRLALDRQRLPLAELEARGLTLLDLESTEESVGLGGRQLVTFAHVSRRPLATKLGPGDLVTVSPRKAEVENPPSGTVTSAKRTSLTVAFERPPPAWLHEGRLRLDITANDVTYERARGALKTWAGFEKGVQRTRRDILLGQTPPRFEKPAAFDASRPLNPEQRDAVQLALSARDFALIHGPPGTGKSTVLAEIAVQLARQGKRLLCCAASNAAVDHLLELCLDAGLHAVRAGHPARVLPHLQQHTLDLLVEEHADRVLARELFDEAFELLGYARKQRTRGRSRSRFANAREAGAEARRLMDEARALERKALDAVLNRAQVVCATLPMLDSHLLRHEAFDVALLDEATQAIEPLSLLAFLRAPTVILAGDPSQLGPTVISPDAHGLGISLFERLLCDFGDGVKCLLKEQHRMHELIMRFPSDATYGGQLRAHPDAAARTLGPLLSESVDAPPVLFLDTAGKGFDESVAPQSESLRNEGEGELIAARVRQLLSAGLAQTDVAVITPYRAQALWLREQLAEFPDVEIDTVDAFQGREKEAVLLSLVRSNTGQRLGFLEDLRRLNVAITRARRHLFVTGDSATLSSHSHYARWIEFITAQGGYRSAWEW